MKRFLAFSFLALALLPAAAHAQQQDASLQEKIGNKLKNADKKNYLSFSYENDLIAGGGDKFYTSGVRATWFNVNTPVPVFMDEVAELVPTFDLNETTSTFFTLGQNMYTPEDIGISIPQDDDRPWAGFLYGSIGLATLTDNHIDEVEATLGIVGPEALGEQTQKAIHRHITSSPSPKGWENQLEFEPGIILSWQRRWPKAFMAKADDFLFRAEPNVNVSVGNIYTYAGTGLMFTFGPYKGRFQDTPPRVRPSMAGSGYFERPPEDWNWYLFAGIDGRAVARNIFLDGNTFKDSPSVDKKTFVGDASAGVALTLNDYRLSYTYNIRSEEFEGRPNDSSFGSITLTARF